jgi:hypothetical protein
MSGGRWPYCAEHAVMAVKQKQPAELSEAQSDRKEVLILLADIRTNLAQSS